jgi:hypothetical protein
LEKEIVSTPSMHEGSLPALQRFPHMQALNLRKPSGKTGIGAETVILEALPVVKREVRL